MYNDFEVNPNDIDESYDELIEQDEFGNPIQNEPNEFNVPNEVNELDELNIPNESNEINEPNEFDNNISEENINEFENEIPENEFDIPNNNQEDKENL